MPTSYLRSIARPAAQALRPARRWPLHAIGDERPRAPDMESESCSRDSAKRHAITIRFLRHCRRRQLYLLDSSDAITSPLSQAAAPVGVQPHRWRQPLSPGRPVPAPTVAAPALAEKQPSSDHPPSPRVAEESHTAAVSSGCASAAGTVAIRRAGRTAARLPAAQLLPPKPHQCPHCARPRCRHRLSLPRAAERTAAQPPKAAAALPVHLGTQAKPVAVATVAPAPVRPAPAVSAEPPARSFDLHRRICRAAGTVDARAFAAHRNH